MLLGPTSSVVVLVGGTTVFVLVLIVVFDGVGVGSGFLLVVVTLVVVVTLLDVGFGGSDVGRLILSLQRPPIHVMM